MKENSGSVKKSTQVTESKADKRSCLAVCVNLFTFGNLEGSMTDPAFPNLMVQYLQKISQPKFRTKNVSEFNKGENSR